MSEALLHYAHVSKWIFLFPQNASVWQSRYVLKDRMDTLVMKGSIVLSVLLSLPLEPLKVRSNNDFCLEKLTRKSLTSHHENNDHFQTSSFRAIFIITLQRC